MDVLHNDVGPSYPHINATDPKKRVKMPLTGPDSHTKMMGAVEQHMLLVDDDMDSTDPFLLSNNYTVDNLGDAKTDLQTLVTTLLSEENGRQIAAGGLEIAKKTACDTLVQFNRTVPGLYASYKVYAVNDPENKKGRATVEVARSLSNAGRARVDARSKRQNALAKNPEARIVQTETTATPDDAAAKRAAMLARMANRHAARVRTPIQKARRERGDFYDDVIRPHVEPHEKGKVAIYDIVRREWIVTEDMAAGMVEMRARHPNGDLHAHMIWPLFKSLGGYQMWLKRTPLAD